MSGKIAPVERPFFLVGAERSGTTVLRLMLDHHPQIAFCSESEFVVSFLPEDGWPDMAEYHEFLGNLRIFQDTGFTIDPGLDYVGLVNSFLRQKQGDKPIVGATVHYDHDRLPRIWPGARYIHMLRDGRDVARSCIGMGWAGNVYTGAGTWIKAEQTWETLRDMLPADRWIDVKYEDLIADHEQELGRTCGFMGVSYDSAMMDYTKHTTYDPPDPKLVYQWKRKMSPEDVQLVEARIAPMLEARGYALSGLPRIEVTPEMERRLWRQDKQAGRRFRLKRYGVGLYATEWITRRLGLKRAHRRLKAQCNAIDQAHLK
jgi:hypothetical protein